MKPFPLIINLTGYDSSNSANIQIPVYESFGHVELLPWVIASFSLANGASAPLVRRLMEVMNPKWFLVTFWLISAGGGAAAGAASNIQTVIVGRVLVGVGISGVYLWYATRCSFAISLTSLTAEF
jgi:MFS family permease